MHGVVEVGERGSVTNPRARAASSSGDEAWASTVQRKLWARILLANAASANSADSAASQVEADQAVQQEVGLAAGDACV